MSLRHDISPQSGESRQDDTQGRKKRIRSWTPYDRAKHRVVERNRREAFGESLMALAREIPNLAEVKESKLSKHLVVEESLALHHTQRAHNDQLNEMLQAVSAERDSILHELNEWRSCLGMPPRQSLAAMQAPQDGLNVPAPLPESHHTCGDSLVAHPPPQTNIGMGGLAAPDLDSSFEPDVLGLNAMVLPGGMLPIESNPSIVQQIPMPGTGYNTGEHRLGTEDWLLRLDAS